VAFAFDFREDGVVEWHRTDGGVRTVENRVYTPSCYVAGESDALADLRPAVEADPRVATTAFEEWHLALDADDRDEVLRVDLRDARGVRTFARHLRREHEPGPPGTLRFYNVDLAPGFRYCVETGTSPVPDRDLRTLRVSLPEPALADRDLTALSVGGDDAGDDERAALETLAAALDARDPDVLVLSSADLVPLLAERAAAREVDLSLGRGDGTWERLAGENTVESYGRVLHSPARYDVPGRAVVDTSNSFLWAESSLDGLLGLVDRSWRPLQETAWASIGTVLTAIQIRRALTRDVLVPWNKWEPEAFTDVQTLHAADRGGLTLDPAVGLHEDVYEVDFASLYPRIICRHNVSPETVECACHADREDVPELGYAVCDDPGFLPSVLAPILEDRREMKRELAATDDEARAAELRARRGALKWILVSCFGYQGYRNAKFGRIECHEAINAVARDVLLRVKDRFEAGGWRVVHGIVDSLWVTPDAADPDPLDTVRAEVTEATGIPLDFEDAYDWVCFVPRRGSSVGALTKYFGKVAGEDRYRVRGVESRQRSTSAFVADAQRDLLETLDRHRDPAAVADRLGRHRRRLRRGEVDPADLVVTNRVSKRPDDYRHRTLTVAALERAEELGLPRRPGQDVRYVVVDADARGTAGVRLDFEEPTDYDADYYEERLLRAGESVTSPLGWDRRRVESHLRPGETVGLSAFE